MNELIGFLVKKKRKRKKEKRKQTIRKVILLF